MCGRFIKKNMKNEKTRFVTIMPCYDKKLEAVRPVIEDTGEKEVDTVIATHELLELFEKLEVKFDQV